MQQMKALSEAVVMGVKGTKSGLPPNSSILPDSATIPRLPTYHQSVRGLWPRKLPTYLRRFAASGRTSYLPTSGASRPPAAQATYLPFVS